MILQALTRYYDIISSDPKNDIAPFGYNAIGVSFALNISAEGKLLDVLPLFDHVKRGKKMREVPRSIFLPARVKRSVNIAPNFLWDNNVYVLGISDKDDEKPEYSIDRFEAFREWHIELLNGIDSIAAQSLLSFLKQHDPTKARQHPAIARYLDTILEGGNLVFQFSGDFLHNNTQIRQIWEAYKANQGDTQMQCLVTGEIAPIARLHPNLKKVRGARPAGATLIGFNLDAFKSYNRNSKKEKGFNAPVSEKATFAYSTVLNYLLSFANMNKKIYLGDTTVVYWAESKNKTYEAVFRGLFVPEYIEQETSVEQNGRKDAERRLGEVAGKVKSGRALDTSKLMEGLDRDTQFYILGLAPNAARVSVRFFHVDPFEKVVNNVMAHYSDLQISKEFDNQPTYITIRQILNETVSKKARNQNPSPLMSGAVFRSILMNIPYPAALYYAIINRIRADMDDSANFIRKINYVRAAVIKAFLIRKYRNKPQHPIMEVLDMALNKQSTIPAYLLGRLFAVLEKVQKEAVPNAKATIKDRYFTSACASPKSVFPTLLRLSQHHISKAEYGYASDKRIQDILNLLDVETNPIPARLNLDEQGVFVLGYYHQRANFFAKNSDEVVESEQTN